MEDFDKLNFAVLRDRLEHFHGASRVAFKISQIFNNAPIYTYTKSEEISNSTKEEAGSKDIEIRPREKSFSPILPKHFQTALFFEELKLPNFDVIINIGPFSKWYNPERKQKFISYCHAPIWSIWPNYENVLKRTKFPKSLLFRIWTRIFRKWELSSLKDIDLLITNSEYSQRLAKKYWGVETEVIYPPVNVSKYESRKKEDFYLMIQPLREYDTGILRAFESLPYELKIVGSGPNSIEKVCTKMSNVEILGYVSEEEKISLLSLCRGLIGNKQKEQFGIVPVEAMASGKPVIAREEGGYTVTVLEGKTGVFFDKDATPEEIAKTIERSELIEWDVGKIQKHAKKFDDSVFEKNISETVNSSLSR